VNRIVGGHLPPSAIVEYKQAALHPLPHSQADQSAEDLQALALVAGGSARAAAA
jgi:hypothetical protein